jgi:hypothetical protein
LLLIGHIARMAGRLIVEAAKRLSIINN